MKKNMNLRQKFILIVAGILFIILAINTTVLMYIASNKYKSAILYKATAIGEGMQSELGKILTLGVPIESLNGVNEKMKELITRDKAIGYSMVTDTTGKILCHNEPESAGKELRDRETQNSMASDKPPVQTSGDFYDLSFPLLNAENKVAGESNGRGSCRH